MHPNFSPFPYIETERLHLRPIALADDKALFFHRTDPDMNRYIDRKRPDDLEEVRQFIQKIMTAVDENKSIFWVISLQHTTALIGTICLWNLEPESASAEVGYALHPDFQGNGYMQEALEKVIEYGFLTLQAKVIKAVVHPQNLPSGRLLERNGFVQTGEEEGLLVFTTCIT